MTRYMVAVDGPPGSGKTTRIVERAEAGELDAVLTYTRDAASVLHRRAPQVIAGTIYSLAWRAGASKTSRMSWRGGTTAAPHNERAISTQHDPALGRYEREAPSRRRKDPQVLSDSHRVHRWHGAGACPLNLDRRLPKDLQHAASLARWLAADAPFSDDFQGFDSIAIDEAQDLSALEIASCLALLKPGGKAWAYGDPGQGIFNSQKGVRGKELPAAWALADDHTLMEGGHRCGMPLADEASRVLAPYWRRPAESFAAPHRTEVRPWYIMDRPGRGLVMGYSRATVARQFEEWGLRRTWISPQKADMDRELVLSTIHAAKGSQADDVYLLPNKKFTKLVAERDYDALKLLYTAMTRARRILFLPPSLKAVMPK